jgi:hypothetical protein
MMSGVALALARLVMVLWLGAGAMFVLVTVQQVMHPGFSSDVKDQLVTLQFPWYYAVGAVCTGCGLLATLVGAAALRRWAGGLAVAVLVCVVSVMAYDYTMVYRPLTRLVDPPGQPRTMDFLTLHQQSRRLNTLHYVLCVVATTVLWTGRAVPPVPSVPLSTDRK